MDGTRVCSLLHRPLACVPESNFHFCASYHSYKTSHLSFRHIQWRFTALIWLEHIRGSVRTCLDAPKQKHTHKHHNVHLSSFSPPATSTYSPSPLTYAFFLSVLFGLISYSLHPSPCFLAILFIFKSSPGYFPCLVPPSSPSLRASLLSFLLPPALISLAGSFSPSPLVS